MFVFMTSDWCENKVCKTASAGRDFRPSLEPRTSLVRADDTSATFEKASSLSALGKVLNPRHKNTRGLYESRVAEPVADVFFEDERSPSCDIGLLPKFATGLKEGKLDHKHFWFRISVGW
jgi:hypothetical protein